MMIDSPPVYRLSHRPYVDIGGFTRCRGFLCAIEVAEPAMTTQTDTVARIPVKN